MAKNVRILHCTPEDVFDVFGDGWLYTTWVVGASRLRNEERGWPEVGTRLHHSFGVWPLVINDETTSLEWDPPRHMVIQPKGWPIGEARVELSVEPHAKGCKVTIVENAVAGPGSWVPGFVIQPLIWIRNRETLRRLGWVATGRARNS
ncbi:polyketide cyclase/dehydrase/lipid transport protein [Curtobacterium sp. PhB130]|uniref:SRPBCC family protein n=1 Tax=unclassified Curtobacterium TaxID=257496 RepID=UPI000F4B7CCF|nr:MULTISPECIES: SRPBCC family protein [unclassified Curtobacterium]ROP63400.1 polyketide cyclase/dehydrase/lipid transport protein [Curtobacterium sp. ZW137]ROS77665.1 polyketide cyclase/dehydrase/lipid transport protein [Curtobacterium sp. PhB130]TCK66127.1 polyketide cyclase/dehydrase/lipid transport protein [Curtobacterium sp. PhB136]